MLKKFLLLSFLFFSVTELSAQKTDSLTCDSIIVPNVFLGENCESLNCDLIPYFNCPARPIEYEMSVFDRWGNRVFFTTDYNKGWNGVNQENGKVCEADTYIYRIKLRYSKVEKPKTYVGHSTFIR